MAKYYTTEFYTERRHKVTGKLLIRHRQGWQPNNDRYESYTEAVAANPPHGKCPLRILECQDSRVVHNIPKQGESTVPNQPNANCLTQKSKKTQITIG